MKVLIQYEETGMYKDSTWSTPSLRAKGNYMRSNLLVQQR